MSIEYTKPKGSNVITATFRHSWYGVEVENSYFIIVHKVEGSHHAKVTITDINSNPVTESASSYGFATKAGRISWSQVKDWAKYNIESHERKLAKAEKDAREAAEQAALKEIMATQPAVTNDYLLGIADERIQRYTEEATEARERLNKEGFRRNWGAMETATIAEFQAQAYEFLRDTIAKHTTNDARNADRLHAAMAEIDKQYRSVVTEGHTTSTSKVSNLLRQMESEVWYRALYSTWGGFLDVVVINWGKSGESQ